MIELQEGAPMARYQHYIHELEELHGWLDLDLIHNCFLMGEEVGELFRAVREASKFYEQAEKPVASDEVKREAVAEEIVDVFNYLLALANRLDIDVEQAFRKKNERNQTRRWG